MSHEDVLKHTVLDANEWRGIRQLANALHELEPLAKRGNLGQVVADRLVASGFAEKGATSDRYQSIGMREGYRLSDLGWKLLDRGRYPKRSAR